MGHECHAEGCSKAIPPALLMCREHWRMVPYQLRGAVLRAYRPGQCDDKRPSAAWLEAARAAINAVAARERRAALGIKGPPTTTEPTPGTGETKETTP